MGRPARPILLFVFANPRRDLALNKETSGIRSTLRSRPEVELIILDHPSLADVEDVFQQRRNQIVLFHYSGHANGFQQMLESDSGGEQRIDSRGFAQFLASQQGLKFVFLNGCSTGGQVDELYEAGVPAVLATNIDVDDELATLFSLRFYAGLASGAALRIAYVESVASIQSQAPAGLPSLDGASRGIRVGRSSSAVVSEFPWKLHAQVDRSLEWTLEQELVSRRTQRGRLEDVAQGQLQQLLNFVKKHWIDGILEQNTKTRLLNLSAIPRLDLVDDPLGSIVECVPQKQIVKADTSSLIEVYRQSDKRLLLLGQPGSGKTTTLLQLCAQLVQEALYDPTLSVPVVFSLSRWSDNSQSLYDWLQTQLVELYSVPRKVAGLWIDNHELTLILDGLDEVPHDLRPGCVMAINSLLDEIGAPGVMFSSRVDEYVELNEKLKVNAVMMLQPLTDAQVVEFVEMSDENLQPLRQLLSKDESLRQLAQSPLLLNVMCQVYDENSSVIDNRTQFESAGASKQELAESLFGRFVERMFHRRGKGATGYTREETEQRMSWLAQRMRNQGTSLFLIELMQPSWLSSRLHSISYVMLVSLTTAIIMGFCAATYWWGVAQISADTARALDSGLYWWLVPILFVWLILAGMFDQFLPNFAARGDMKRWKSTLQGLSKWAIYFTAWIAMLTIPALVQPSQWNSIWIYLVMTGALGSILLAIVGWNHRTILDIKPVEAIRFSYRSAIKGAPWGGAAGLFIWLVFRLVWSEEPKVRLALFPEWQAVQGFGFMFIAFLTIGTICGALLGGLERSSIKLRTRPNQGMINSRRNALFAGLLSGVILTLTILLVTLTQELEGTNRTPTKLLYFSLCAGWLVATSVGMISGGFDYLKHQVLRAILVTTGQLPRRLVPFLNYCCELDFLKRVGGGFLFLHRLLLEHFSELTNDRRK